MIFGGDFKEAPSFTFFGYSYSKIRGLMDRREAMGGNIDRWFSLKARSLRPCELDLSTHGHATAASSLGAVHCGYHLPVSSGIWKWNVIW